MTREATLESLLGNGTFRAGVWRRREGAVEGFVSLPARHLGGQLRVLLGRNEKFAKSLRLHCSALQYVAVGEV